MAAVVVGTAATAEFELSAFVAIPAGNRCYCILD